MSCQCLFIIATNLFAFTNLLLIASNLFPAEPLDLGTAETGIEFAEKGAIDDPQLLLKPPENNNNSIQYLLFTKRKDKPCYTEPSAEKFNNCSFNSDQGTKFIIHGFMTNVPPDSRFFDIKDALLAHDRYNVFVVDWSRYNNPPFALAYKYSQIVGEKVAEMMEFITNRTGAMPESFHCIGHSLGSNVCGQAGRLTPNLGRITGLDPEGGSKLLMLQPNIRLRYTDAQFVDTIHTGDIFSGNGFGYLDAIGHMDFYPNGGVKQNHCKIGRRYKMTTSKVYTIQTPSDEAICNHHIVFSYFTNSIRNNCSFVATKCDDYHRYKLNMCSILRIPITALMGFPSERNPRVPPNSKFFLDTLEFPSYCQK